MGILSTQIVRECVSTGAELTSNLNGLYLDAGMSFKVNISKRDWVTMHQPAFQATVEAGVTSVMCRCAGAMSV